MESASVMKWIILSILLDAFKLISTQKDTHLTITDRQCGKTYKMAWYKSAYLEYHGSDLLEHNPCSVEFENEESTDKFICISTQQISIDCETKVEFHHYFIKRYNQPERKILCHNATLDEWCGDAFPANVFVVIKKPKRHTSDIIKLRVYRKECQGYTTSSQPVSSYQPIPQEAGSQQLPAGYHIHTMQIAAPVNQGTSQAGSNQPLVAPSAPSMEPDEAPPPSYDSLWS
ncbi:uncharacterized protein LOC128547879 isoform X3 [Mercenaria mercenaria]|uniref:uncharacterized protein LOC128547879 isoform X3 n=1 Tax=Mercenaria mercenaria TaxID=6596 RepID=UPI00234E989C|nr:uncharacterized protein LOC128547879 isoform X3 [Mercenaria mercenaria]